MYAWSSMYVILQLIYFIQLISHKISSQPVYLYRSIYYIKLISFSSIWNIIPIFRSSFNLSVPYSWLIKQWQQTLRGLHVQRVTIVTRSFAPRRLNFVSKQMKMCFSCVLIAVPFHTPWPEIPSQFLHLFGGKKSLMRRKPAPPPLFFLPSPCWQTKRRNPLCNCSSHRRIFHIVADSWFRSVYLCAWESSEMTLTAFLIIALTYVTSPPPSTNISVSIVNQNVIRLWKYLIFLFFSSSMNSNSGLLLLVKV